MGAKKNDKPDITYISEGTFIIKLIASLVFKFEYVNTNLMQHIRTVNQNIMPLWCLYKLSKEHTSAFFTATNMIFWVCCKIN